MRVFQEFRRGDLAVDPTIINGILALIAGISILIMPELLNYVVAIYLIVHGILLLLRS